VAGRRVGSVPGDSGIVSVDREDPPGMGHVGARQVAVGLDAVKALAAALADVVAHEPAPLGRRGTTSFLSFTVDSSLFLAAARGLLERQGMVVVSVASTKAQALHLAAKLRPDVTLRIDPLCRAGCEMMPIGVMRCWGVPRLIRDQQWGAAGRRLRGLLDL
jgi:hypothetical protein